MMSMHHAKNLNDHVGYTKTNVDIVMSIRTRRKIMKSMYHIVKTFLAM